MKDCAENLDPSQWFFLYVFTVEFIYLKVRHQCFQAWTLQSSVNMLFFFFFFCFFFNLNTLLNWCAIATSFVLNSFRNWFIRQFNPDVKIITANVHRYFTLHISAFTRLKHFNHPIDNKNSHYRYQRDFRFCVLIYSGFCDQNHDLSI